MLRYAGNGQVQVLVLDMGDEVVVVVVVVTGSLAAQY